MLLGERERHWNRTFTAFCWSPLPAPHFLGDDWIKSKLFLFLSVYLSISLIRATKLLLLLSLSLSCAFGRAKKWLTLNALNSIERENLNLSLCVSSRLDVFRECSSVPFELWNKNFRFASAICAILALCMRLVWEENDRYTMKNDINWTSV